MRLIVGIGNPGPEYAKTRHNVGFDALDRAAQALSVSFLERGPSMVAEGTGRAGPFRLIKPQGYVNRTGPTLLATMPEVASFPRDDILVVLDDMALPPGRARLKGSGSAGGHNGMASVIATLGGESVPRLKVGIGSVPPDQWKEHVLRPFPPDEVPVIDEVLERVVHAISGFVDGEPFLRLQNMINSVSPPGMTRGTGRAGDAESSAPHVLAVGRSRRQGVSNVENTRNYEGLFLLNLSRIASDHGKGVQLVRGVLEKHGAKIVDLDVWDERKLAYPVEKQKRGLYVLTHFHGTGTVLDGVTHDVNISEDLMRHTFRRIDGDFPEFPRRKKRREDEGESSAESPVTSSIKDEDITEEEADADSENNPETNASTD